MTRARDLSKLANSSAFTISDDLKVGINSTSPTSNLSVGGTVTAGNFSGNGSGLTNVQLTGSTTLSSLTVTNNASVGGALTVTGNMTVNGTQTIINSNILDITDKNVGIASGNSSDAQADGAGVTIYAATNKTLTYNDTKRAFETNIAWSPNETRLLTSSEKYTMVAGNTVNLVYNSNSSNIGLCTTPSGNITLNVTGIPTSSDFNYNTLSFSVIVWQSGVAGAAYSCTAVTLNGTTRPIHWSGGSLGAAISGVTTANGYDIYSFTGINTIGTANTCNNYILLGSVNGAFR